LYYFGAKLAIFPDGKLTELFIDTSLR